MPTPLVEVSNLTKQYSSNNSYKVTKALDGVSLSVAKGEIVGVVGESGSGKTTLGRCILRLIDPTSGTVRFDGQDVFGLKGKNLQTLRRRMQIVFQDPFASLDPRWRIDQILDEPLRIHKVVPPQERKGEIARLLTEVGLSDDAAYRFPHEFSGGQRQRIGIARAIAVRPDFMIADEPVSALDVSVRAQILNLLLKLRDEKGIAILFIAHDLGVVRQISSRIAVLYQGTVMETADVDELFENPRNPYTRSLLAAIPSVHNIGGGLTSESSLAGDAPTVNSATGGCNFRSRCGFAQEICATKTPALVATSGSPGHLSACHFSNNLPVFVQSNAIKDEVN